MRGLVLIVSFLLAVTLGTAHPANAEIPPIPCPNCADIMVAMSDAPHLVRPGAELAYTIDLSNTGPATAMGVTLTDPIPDKTTFVSFKYASPSGGADAVVAVPPAGSRGVVAVRIATLPWNDHRLFVITVRVDAGLADGSTITNTVAATATVPADTTAQNNTATTTTVVDYDDPTLSLSIADGPDPVYAGQNGASRGGGFSYLITLTNESASEARDVSLSDAIPASTTFGGWFQESGPAFTRTAPPARGVGTVTATIDSLAPGASAAFRLRVDVSCDARDGSVIDDTATVSWGTAGGARSTSATATTLVATVADIGFTGSSEDGPVAAGGNLTYDFKVGSGGPSDSQNVTFRDDIPAHTTFVSFSQMSGPAATLTTLPAGGTGTVTAAIPTLPCGQSATFRVVVNVDTGTAPGTVISNTATVTATTRDPNGGGPFANSVTKTTDVTALTAELLVSMSDAPDPVQVEGVLSYDIAVVNNGPDQATNIWLTDQVPFKTSFVSFTQTAGPAFTLTPSSYAKGSSTAQGALASGESATFTLVVKLDPDAAAGAVISNTAYVKSYDAYDPASANNSASTTTDVTAGP